MKAINTSVLPKADLCLNDAAKQDFSLSDLRGSPVRSDIKRRSRRRERHQLKALLRHTLHDDVLDGIAAYKKLVDHERTLPSTAAAEAHAKTQPVPHGTAFVILRQTAPVVAVAGRDMPTARVIPLNARDVTVIRKRQGHRPTVETLRHAA